MTKGQNVYYSEDFKTVKEVPEHRLQFRTQASQDQAAD